jgi:hypothetical protein
MWLPLTRLCLAKLDFATLKASFARHSLPQEESEEGRARFCYFGTIDLNFSRSRMFILKPPGITTSPGF